MPHRLDQLELHDVLGSGGMAVVYAGVHSVSRAPVAVKVMTSHLARGARYRRAFLREIQSIARLDHPGIVRVIDIGEVPPELERESAGHFVAGAPYIVMELIRGGSLDEFEALSAESLRRVTLELLDALAHAHARGVVHRDLKPSNIMLDVGPQHLVTKLTDFGIARLFDVEHPTDPSDSERRISGTPKYMAPERVMGRWRDQGPWTDLYSLGILIWQAVTGTQPFDGETQEILLAHVREQLPPFVPQIDVPERLELWLLGMLAKSPHRRFRRAADAAVAFEQAWKSPVSRRSARQTTSPVEQSGESTRDLLPTLTSVLERRPGGGYGRLEELATDWRRPAIPSDWRRPAAPQNEVAPGPGLFGVRAIPVVGREHERDALWRTLVDVLRSGRVRVVQIRGPAGAGKTRLASWLCARAAEVGAADVLQMVHSDSSDGRGEGLRGMLTRLFRTDGLGDAVLPRIHEELREITAGDPLVEYDAPALGQIIQSDESATRSVEFLSPAERFHAIRRLLRHLGRRRAQILCVDDAHLAVEAVQLARFLMAEDTPDLPVLIVLCTRTEGPFAAESVQNDLEELATVTGGSHVSIGRMTDGELRELVLQSLALAPELVDDIVRRADGSPTFAIQAARSWVESHALVPGPRGLELSDDRIGLPDGVHELWLHRLNHVVDILGDDAGRGFEALQLAALLGLHVDQREWDEVHASNPFGRSGDTDDREMLTRLVDGLQKLGHIDRDRLGWSFAAPTMRESLLRSARSTGRAVDLHRICAGALRGLHALDEPSPALRIATHLHACGDDDGALEILFAAIHRAKGAHDYDWLERLSHSAGAIIDTLQLDESDGQRGILEVTRARLLAVRNQVVDAEAAYRTVLDKARRHGWRQVEGETTFLLGSNALARGHTEQALIWYRAAEALYDELGDALNLARAREGIGYTYLHMGHFREATAFVEGAATVFEAHDEPRDLSFNLYHRGIIARYEGDTARARQCYEGSLAMAGRYGFRDTVANAHNALGDLDRYAGQLARATKHYHDAYDLWSALGAAGANISSINLGITLVQQHRWDDAARILEPLAARLRDDDAGLQLMFARAALLPVYAAQEDQASYDEALALIDAYLREHGVHDPDLELLRDLCAEQWGALGDEVRADAVRAVFGPR